MRSAAAPIRQEVSTFKYISGGLQYGATARFAPSRYIF
jgi:hypothetical protein